MFQLGGRIVTDARHEADLMIDEDERRVLGSQGFVRSGLIGHVVLLGLLREDLRSCFPELPLRLFGKWRLRRCARRPRKPPSGQIPDPLAYFALANTLAAALSCPAAKAPVAACSMR